MTDGVKARIGLALPVPVLLGRVKKGQKKAPA